MRYELTRLRQPPILRPVPVKSNVLHRAHAFGPHGEIKRSDPAAQVKNTLGAPGHALDAGVRGDMESLAEFSHSLLPERK